MRKSLLGLLVICSHRLSSQNLVPNPGFERYSGTQILAWESTALSPDFYNALINKPEYDRTHCGASIGDGFLGIMLCGEVASAWLLSPLEKDQDYLVSVFVQKPRTFCPGGVKKATVAFTSQPLPKYNGKGNYYYPVPFLNLYHDQLKPLKENCRWVEFSCLYKATGTENHFHIGDFRKTRATDTIATHDVIMIDSLEGSNCAYMHFDSIVVRKIATGNEHPIVIEGILFETAKSTLLPSSYEALDKLYGFIIKARAYKVKIVGHTDNAGDAVRNLVLSKERAASVLNYLVKKGIPKKRLSSSGQGDKKPVAGNDTEEGKARNRRVEITLERID